MGRVRARRGSVPPQLNDAININDVVAVADTRRNVCCLCKTLRERLRELAWFSSATSDAVTRRGLAVRASGVRRSLA